MLMKPLVILIAVFLVTILLMKLFMKEVNFPLAGRIAMAAMLVFTAIGHFAFTAGMAAMIPDIIPGKTALVYFTGVLELLFALGLLNPSYRTQLAWLLILFFILVLPANIKASLEHINYQTGEANGNGPAYLWLRIPMQLFFIGWVYFSAIRGT